MRGQYLVAHQCGSRARDVRRAVLRCLCCGNGYASEDPQSRSFGEATLITVFVLFPISTPHTIAITIFIAHTIVIPISTDSNSVRPNLNVGHLRENDCSGSLGCDPN
jgi:hypothetical protein